MSRFSAINAKGLDDVSEDDLNLVMIKDNVREILEFRPWFDYPLAKTIIKKLGRVYTEAIIDEEIRPLSYFIYGDINSGKTTLVTRYRNIMKKLKGFQIDDILYFEIPVRATLKQVFAKILAKLGKKITGNALRNTHTQDLVDSIIEELERRKVKILFIDELQDLIVATNEDKRAIFTGFKKILNNCSTRLVLIGTPAAKDLLYLDDWIDERLIVLDIPKWKDGQDFRKLLLAIYKAYVPFVPDWDLIAVKSDNKIEYNYPIVQLLLKLSGGRLGKLLQIIQYSIIEAVEKDQSNILLENYQDIFNQSVKYVIEKGKIVRKTKADDEKDKQNK